MDDGDNIKMEKNEIRALIKYLCLKNMSTKDIHNDLVETSEDSVPYSTVARWAKEFKLGRTSTEDAHREGCPSTSRTEDIVKKVEDIVLEDRRVTIGHIAEVTRISFGSIQRILTLRLHIAHEEGLGVLGPENVNRRAEEETIRHFESKSRKVLGRPGEFCVTLCDHGRNPDPPL